MQSILGEERFAVLCTHYWRDLPPTSGDLGAYGGTLASYIADQTDDVLVNLPFLADVAQLDWAVHQVERALEPVPLDWSRWTLLARPGLTHVHFEFAAATALIQSGWCLVTQSLGCNAAGASAVVAGQAVARLHVAEAVLRRLSVTTSLRAIQLFYVALIAIGKRAVNS